MRNLAAKVPEDVWPESARVACFMDEACIAHLRFPVTHRRAIRTTNLLERLFVEERRRLKIIPNAFGERAVLKLMCGALIRASERWRSVKVTEFERRQIAGRLKRARSGIRGPGRPQSKDLKEATQVKIQQFSDWTKAFRYGIET